MSELSSTQEELRQSIQKSAITWAVILGVIAALIAYWIMGSQEGAVRLGGAAVLGLGAGFGIYRWIFLSRARSARCEKCGAAFSISRSNREETLIASEAKEEREPQDDGKVKVNSWVEEKFDVLDTYTCSSCADVTTKQHQITRRKDEESVVEDAPIAKVAGLSGGAGGKGRPGRAGRDAPSRDTKTDPKPKNTDPDSSRQ